MAAEGEEVGLRADLGQVEQLLPDGGEQGLGRGTRRIVRSPCRDGRSRERLAIQFAVGRQWQRIEQHEGTRQHVVGQTGLEVAAQLGYELCSICHLPSPDPSLHHVGDEALLAWCILTGNDGYLLHCGVAAQHALNLAQLDTEAADLHLLIDTPQILQVTIGQPTGQVARTVEAPRAKGVGNELLRRELWPVQVAPPDLYPADVQLTCHANRHRLKRSIEHIGLSVCHWPANRDDTGGVVSPACPRSHIDRRLRRPVPVVEACRGMGLETLL